MVHPRLAPRKPVVYHRHVLAIDSRTDSATRVALAAIVVVATLLFATNLDRVPIHLHHDEIYFGLIAHAVSETGSDPNGRFLPVYFQMDQTFHWYPPLIIYLTAALLKIVPLSDVAVRLPNAIVGVISVILMYFVARRTLRSNALGLIAAAILALTPAHFINSRIATDSLYPVAFILGWMLALDRYFEQPTTRRLLWTTAVLGIGMYSYIASIVLMPIYLLITLAALYGNRSSLATLSTAVGGFVLPLMFAVAFLVWHPEVVGHFSAKYELAQTGPQLNAFQQLREAFTPWNVSDHLNLFHSSFSPGYLFVTGGSNIAHSTRLAGVFLAPMAVFLVAGIVDAITRPTRMTAIALAGFLTAPAAASLVPEEYAIPRMLGLLPFGVLLGTAGIARLWQVPLNRPAWPLSLLVGGGLAATGAAYATWMSMTQAHLSPSAVLLILGGGVVWLVGRETDRRRNWRPVTVCLLLLMPLQFVVFAADYFGDYRARSAGRYEYNVRGAIEQLIARHDRTPGVPMYLNDDVLFVRAYWEFYLRLLGRTDLRGRQIMFDSNSEIPADMPSGSLVLTDVNQRAMARLDGRPDFARVAEATDPVSGSSPPEERTTFVIFQKQ